MHDTKKGKYTDEENEMIIDAINQGLKEGRKERDIIKDLSYRLNRGYSGIMSYVRKLRAEYPDRFHFSSDDEGGQRLNNWEKSEEELVIQVVNEFSEKGKPLSSAIVELEQKLSRTQGAIYQRIYSLRRKYPERFRHLPAKRPRKRNKLANWKIKRPVIRPLEEFPAHAEIPQQDLNAVIDQQLSSTSDYLLSTPVHSHLQVHDETLSEEERLVVKAFEKRYGRPNHQLRKKFIHLMRTYGCTKVSIALFTITEDKTFPNVIIEFLEERLQNNKLL